MSSRRHRVFLGAYLNITNAQNLNCRALAQNIDLEKYTVAAMELPSGELSSISSSVKIIQTRWPHRISKYWAYFYGIWWSDVVYLPKAELPRWSRFCCWLFSKPNFSTSESVDEGTNWEKQLQRHRNTKRYLTHYSGFTALYAISPFIAKRNNELLGIKYEGVLPLGVDLSMFNFKRKKGLSSVVLIANNLYYKGWAVYLKLAERFPLITFHVVGSGMSLVNPQKESQHLNNVVCHGQLTHQQLNRLLQKIDLHVFPSRSEGFPKVLLECAAAGVSSVVFSDYGAREWLKSGFVVDTEAEMERQIQLLIQNPEVLQKASLASYSFAKTYSWSQIVKQWESVFSSLRA